jgi:hypothetical protein
MLFSIGSGKHLDYLCGGVVIETFLRNAAEVGEPSYMAFQKGLETFSWER